MRSTNACARWWTLSKVEPRLTIVSGSATSCLISLVGRGVVVTTACGLAPRRRPSSAWSNASGLLPRRQFVQPQLFMLLAAQPVRLFGREQQRRRAVRPGEAAGGARVARPLAARADRHQSGFAQHHHVAHVVVGRADQVDDGEALHPFAHRLGAGAGLAGAAAGEDQPVDPVARRRPLVVARPQRPVAEDLVALLVVQRRQQLGALGGRQREQRADVAQQRRGAAVVAPAAGRAARAAFAPALRGSLMARSFAPRSSARPSR